MRNVIQYASAFSALGCKLEFNSSSGEMDVIEIPKDKRSVVELALADIAIYEDTANYADGMAIFALADQIDDKPNPVNISTRKSILSTVLGYTNHAGKYYRPLIHSIKVQRSWHTSTKPNSCSNFGEICTHRGIDIPEGRRGRKSYRNPNEYHTASSRGIAREQLVTPNLNAMYVAIPEENLAVQSATRPTNVSIEDVIQNMTPEQASELIEKLKSRLQ
jgi:hypothetical protein